LPSTLVKESHYIPADAVGATATVEMGAREQGHARARLRGRGA